MILFIYLNPFKGLSKVNGQKGLQKRNGRNSKSNGRNSKPKWEEF